MEPKKVTRWKASGIHLAISASIAAAVLTVMLVLWYPGPLLEAAGGRDLLLILTGVDVVLGPLITLIIFKAGKRGLMLDLTVIGLVQLSALVYGMHIVYVARPAFIVFVKDQFQMASAVEIEPEEFAKAKYPQFARAPRSGPLWAFADFPTDVAAKQRLLDKTFAGYDMQHFPEYYAPYAERTRQVLEKAWTMEKLRSDEPQAAKVVDEYLARSGIKDSEVRYVRLRARQAWLAVLIDPKTAQPLAMLITEKI